MSDEFEEEIGDDSRSLIKELVSQVRPGMDLSRIVFPSFVLEPRSWLEKLTDQLAHVNYIADASKLSDPGARMVKMAEFFAGGWHVRPRGCKKPYNPLLGEVFRCNIAFPQEKGNGELFYVAEQVSHHPPVTAFHWESKANNIKGTGWIRPRSKFSFPNSVQSAMQGRQMVTLGAHKETYVITFPDAFARGVLMGKLRSELSGKPTIECVESGWRANFEFIEKGFWGGGENELKATVYNDKGDKTHELSGRWDQVITTKACSGGATHEAFHAKNTPVVTINVPPSAELAPHESRLVWDRVTKGITSNDMHDATEGKCVLEEWQREQAKRRQAENKSWVPALFMCDTETFEEEDFDVAFTGNGAAKPPQLVTIPEGMIPGQDDVDQVVEDLSKATVADADPAAAAAPAE
eukprot:GFYU01002686.1.p1 GENE.GFYU01002686.1~~GFYU01002686.1.p1  ORF type:complete len:408 (-),score=114.63 GFYU01002686.1:413-1636(-)